MDQRATRRNVPLPAAADGLLPVIQKSDATDKNHLKGSAHKVQNQDKTTNREERRAYTMTGRSLAVVATFVALQLLYFLYVGRQKDQKSVSAYFYIISGNYVSYHFANNYMSFLLTTTLISLPHLLTS